MNDMYRTPYYDKYYPGPSIKKEVFHEAGFPSPSKIQVLAYDTDKTPAYGQMKHDCVVLPQPCSSANGYNVPTNYTSDASKSCDLKIMPMTHALRRKMPRRKVADVGRTETLQLSRNVGSSLFDDGEDTYDENSELFQPAFCPNVLEMSINTPPYLQQGRFNFRNLYSSFLPSHTKDILSLRRTIINSLRKHGVCVLNRFMGQTVADGIMNEVKSLHSGAWRQGQSIGLNKQGRTARQDMVTWLEGNEPQYPSVQTLCAKLDEVVGSGTGVAQNYSICGSTKAMVARYRGNGSGYQLHVDNPSKDGRCLTCIYYLNKNWRSETMGGNLRLHAKTSGNTADVSPIFDRVIFFYSDKRNPHEVLPAYEDRYAITLWYFDLTERAKAIERLSTTMQ